LAGFEKVLEEGFVGFGTVREFLPVKVWEAWCYVLADAVD